MSNLDIEAKNICESLKGYSQIEQRIILRCVTNNLKLKPKRKNK
jgi:hypothetical protein